MSTRHRIVLAALALVMIVVAVIAIAALRDGDSAAPSPSESPTAHELTASEDLEVQGACPEFEISPPSVPIVAPKAIWVRRGFVEIPTSTAKDGSSVNGPSVLRDDDPLSCFAHTPTGALFAAVASAADALYPPTLAEWAGERVVGPGRDAAVDSAETVSPQATSDGRSISVIGFRFLDCNASDRCSMDLVYTVTLPDGTTASSAGVAAVFWSDGDWRYFDDGVPDKPRPVDPTNLEAEGYVRWAQ